ncbi:PINIT domain-containing protein [Cyathus striatus]|nr:PINIT domain-containing protein [Cyathus striatus]
MASSDAWLDFEQFRHSVKNNTVDRLKQILSGMNEECGTHFHKSGKKQEIIDRIVSTLDSWRASNFEDRWLKAKNIISHVKTTGVYRQASYPSVVPTASHSHAVFNSNGVSKTPSHPGTSSTSSISRYDPYAPPRKPNPTSSIASTSTAPRPTGIRFKESPFFMIDQAVSGVVECPESTSATDRKQQTLSFTLNADQIAKLKAPDLKYQLRLFCTSSVFYAGHTGFRTSTLPCPIEFPPTCEVRVNSNIITANLKGLKKKPGTAPPADIGKYTRMTSAPNRVEIVYVNSQQPAQTKKFFLVVMLVQSTGVDELVKKLKDTRYRSGKEIKDKMIASLAEDDDIIAGPQKMSLKCPLSFMRVNTPCRSSKCVHSQCFDAMSWYSVMEQTTTWLCPVCEHTLDYKDLIVDGYFDEILKQTSDIVEDVVVEADGEWHTADNKFASAKWKSEHAPVAPTPSPRKPPSITPTQVIEKLSNGSALPNENGKGSDVEVLVLDSDDEDEGRVKRELSPSNVSPSHSYSNVTTTSVPATQTQSQSQSDVIDLTLDSEDEGLQLPPAPIQTAKRKASEAGLDALSPTEQIWKKGRPDGLDRTLAQSGIRAPAPGVVNGVDHSRQLPLSILFHHL